MRDTDMPAPPADLQAGGLALFTELTDAFELGQHEIQIAIQAARTVDRLDAMAVELQGQPLTVQGIKPGTVVSHPLIVESRQLSLALARLIASLRIPDEESGERRPHQRSGGARAPYKLTAVKDA